MTAAVCAVSRARPNLVNTSDLERYFWLAHQVRVKPATVRQWAHRRKIKTHGHRRERYDLREVVAYARAQGIVKDKERGNRGATDHREDH